MKKFNKKENRKENEKSLLKTFKKLRDIINTNITDNEKVHWCTLTYKENMTDLRQLYSDFDKFIKRFKYNAVNRKLGAFSYISVVEPQKRGAWHIHLLVIWENKRPFILNNDFRNLWGNGFVNIQDLKNVDNVGAYLTAYLTNLEEETKEEDLKEKKYIKGERLKLYPSGMNLYRTSKNIKKPIESYEIYKKIDKSELGKKTYQQQIKIQDSENKTINVIFKEYYNKKTLYNNNNIKGVKKQVKKQVKKV